MSLLDKIGYKTEASVGNICNVVSPSCIGCPSAKSYVSTDLDLMRDQTKVKISLRCDKIGMSGPACPDGGSPGGTYLKDLGITRTLGEQLMTHSFEISGIESAEMGNEDLLKQLRSTSFVGSVDLLFKEAEYRTAIDLHELHGTLDFLTADSYALEEPIIWRGEKNYKTFSEGRSHYITEHFVEYKKYKNSSIRRDGLCLPTSYMKAHFPKEYANQSFAILTDPPVRAKSRRRVEAVRDDFGNVEFFGDDIPKQPKTCTPDPAQDELYEDWGNFA